MERVALPLFDFAEYAVGCAMMPLLVTTWHSADLTACGIETNVQADTATQGGIGLLLIDFVR